LSYNKEKKKEKKAPGPDTLHGPEVLSHGAVDIHDATGSQGQYTRKEKKSERDRRSEQMPGYIRTKSQQRNGGGGETDKKEKKKR
jgi:hypothetical protein